MSPILLVVIALLVIIGLVIAALALGVGSKEGRASVSNLVKNQRSSEGEHLHGTKKENPAIHNIRRKKNQLNQQKHYGEGEELERRLRCAGWNMMPLTFRLFQIGGSFSAALLFFTFGFGLKVLWLPFGFGFGLVIVNSVLERKIQKRFKNFDNDYPNFLLSMCGLLKTGMNPMQAIEVAVEPLDDSSLLRIEVKLMTERLRFGVLEEASIGAFGENIDHPEIELFVQALLLSRRLGGTLSDTLDRLAKQVRKRQFFRGSANAAVSLQRGSVWVIIGILLGLMGYILIVYPPLVTAGFELPMGKIIWQAGLILMMTGIWWVRQITKLRI